FLTAGDAFGATPALSNMFDDVPAVKALGLMGIQADTFGNHNFDGGLAHLQSLIDLSAYPYVSSNLTGLSASISHVASPYLILTAPNGIRVGLLGVTNDDAPSLLLPGAM